MSSVVSNVTFDCLDARARPPVLDSGHRTPREADAPTRQRLLGVSAPDGGWPRLVFVTVPEGKSVKNRVHPDILPVDSSQEEEVARLLDLGASVVDDRRHSSPGGWVVMADPEGNEFCVEQLAS